MDPDVERTLRGRLDEANFAKLAAIGNRRLHEFVAEAIDLGGPDSVHVTTDDPSEAAYVRELSLRNGEERPLAASGHTIHYDGYEDQGRDTFSTKYLLPPGEDMGGRINAVERERGLAEVRGLLAGAMAGRQMLVRFLCLGIPGSAFAIPVVQITDSAYVGHSEDLLYRTGYEEFRRRGDAPEFFRFLHSAGRMEGGVSADWKNRRVYIDLQEEIVYSVNTQYAGNTVGLKKLALRLAIRKAAREKWLAEHMFMMGAHGPGGRVTYFLGAFPSACGKTSTAMIPGQTIVGDDLAYLRNIGGELRSVNVERGIFGIIQDVNEKDDPVIWKVLTSPGEVIFSNVLVKDGRPYWLGMGIETPQDGRNHSGEWRRGKTDSAGRPIDLAHPNARYTLRIDDLANRDPDCENPAGIVPLGIIYGGRDSDTCVPVEEAFDWEHGAIAKGASIESETTTATLGQAGVRKFNPMSNLDFLSMPIGAYVAMHLEFGKGLRNPPRIFSVNYFLKDGRGEYLTGKLDKRVWLQWMELRCHGEVGSIRMPTGFIPRYEDLEPLFRRHLGKDYSRDEYSRQFAIRVPELLAKCDRITEIYRAEREVPGVLLDVIARQRERLDALRASKGDYVSPLDL
ncbi:MAG: phosphoenolpyruvate carboxykinase (GTP) [Myxococcota bacterium]|nr:phosphoenolpyruvate carboxykinase (GTP) [Myxococcota bacterium]